MTQIRTLVRLEILYVALNMMHLSMKSVTNTQVLRKISSVYNAFHGQMQIIKMFIYDYQSSYLGHKQNSKYNFLDFK